MNVSLQPTGVTFDASRRGGTQRLQVVSLPSYPQRQRGDLEAHMTRMRASQVAQTVKNPPEMQEARVPSLGWEDPLGKVNGNLLQYSCRENSMGRSESLADYNPWGCKESDTTEPLTHTYTHTHRGHV